MPENELEDLPEPSTPLPTIELHKAILLKPSTAMRQHADVTINVEAKRRLNAEEIETRYFTFLSSRELLSAFEKQGARVAHTIKNHIKTIWATQDPDNTNYSIEHEVRSFKTRDTGSYAIPFPHKYSTDKVQEEYNEANKQRKEANDQLHAMQEVWFSEDFKNIFQKCVTMKHRSTFLAMIRAQCTAGTEDFCEAYKSPGTIEHLWNKLRDAGTPALHSVRILTTEQLQRYQNIEGELTETNQNYTTLKGRHNELATKHSELMKKFEALREDHLIQKELHTQAESITKTPV